ncbi:MAG: KH domain-containing protein [Candidatus Bathyarchaeia archaeon]
MEQKSYVNIPLDRVAILIGPEGTNKEKIERCFGVELDIDSDTGNVKIKLDSEQEDVSVIFTVRNVVKAIGRGFSPRKALNLMNMDYDLMIIDLEEHVGTSKRAQRRVKGRVIGRGGKARALIEELTGCYLSVYGSTISIIGSFDAIPVTREAVMMLIDGAFHKSVWNYLYSYRRKLRKEEGRIWYDSGPDTGSEIDK